MTEYALVEWLWDQLSLTVYLPDGRTEGRRGGNSEAAALLTELAGHGWEVVSSVAEANWIVWTVKRG